MILEELRFRGLIKDFGRYVKEGMDREEIREKLRFCDLRLVDHLGYIMEVKVKREERDRYGGLSGKYQRSC